MNELLTYLLTYLHWIVCTTTGDQIVAVISSKKGLVWDESEKVRESFNDTFYCLHLIRSCPISTKDFGEEKEEKKHAPLDDSNC